MIARNGWTLPQHPHHDECVENRKWHAMTLIETAVLGVVQGITEFLPVSSSGHLVIFQHLFGIREEVLAIDIAVHVGTLLAVAAFYLKDLVAIVKGAAVYAAACFRQGRFRMPGETAPEARMAALIILGSVPTGIIGILFIDTAETLFSSVTLVGVSFCVTGVVLWGTRRSNTKHTGAGAIGTGKALVIGIVQGLAIIPGISRSGFTIATGLYLGLNRETAARFSFLLSIPVVAGAGLVGALDLASGTSISVPVMAAGLVTSTVVGYNALSLLVWIVKKGRMHLFAPYCVAAGLLFLHFGLV